MTKPLWVLLSRRGRPSRRPVAVPLWLEQLEDRRVPAVALGVGQSVGAFDPTTATWFLRNENSAGAPDAGQFQFGAAGWSPVVGDWGGSGSSGVGAFDPSSATWFLRNEASGGAPDAGQFQFGAASWVPVAGDWGGSGH
ncbi:MAG TPA: hypothetical protein VFE78_04770, partial [Gemmataceae bacterium]|nr:hypothetical protein [Gemmataceae bacterium]